MVDLQNTGHPSYAWYLQAMAEGQSPGYIHKYKTSFGKRLVLLRFPVVLFCFVPIPFSLLFSEPSANPFIFVNLPGHDTNNSY